jgi:general L-amino acid transport system permease protein
MLAGFCSRSSSTDIQNNGRALAKGAAILFATRGNMQMTGAFSWRSRAVRSMALQAVFVAALGTIIVLAIITTRSNLAAQGLTSGFDFLWKSTNWEMNFTLLPAGRDDPYWWFLVLGLMNTLFMGIIGLAGATVLGLAVGLMRTARNPSVKLMGTIYIELFRNLPVIVQLFFWYALANSLPPPREAIQVGGFLLSSRGIYVPGLGVGQGTAALAVLFVVLGLVACLWIAFSNRFRRLDPRPRRQRFMIALGAGLAAAVLTQVVGHDSATPWVSFPQPQGLKVAGGFRVQPEFYCLAITIITYGAAYIGEIVRGGFKAVGRGQTEAARALGLTPWQVFSRVRMPLAFRAMLPILINQYVWLIKATTLGIAVGFSDFFMVVATSINHSGQTLEFIGILMAGFLLINFSLSSVLNRLNRAIALKGHQTGGAA